MTSAVKWGLLSVLGLITGCEGKDSGDTGASGSEGGGSRSIDLGSCPEAVLEGAGELPLVAVRHSITPFLMGNADDADAAPVHDVTLTQRFQLTITEVTQGQWETLGFANPSQNAGCTDCPVEQVTWHEAASFANAYAESDGYTACYACEGDGADTRCEPVGSPYECDGWRLPTEAEWELAAGQDGGGWAGGDDPEPYAWTAEWTGRPCPVGTLEPTSLGVYDLSGNVSEWVHDGYAAYSADAVTNPYGDDSSALRAVRGGSAFETADRATVTTRTGEAPEGFVPWRGFRLARTVF